MVERTDREQPGYVPASSSPPPGAVLGTGGPGPRQEYLDAFNEENFGRGRRPGRQPAAEPPRPARPRSSGRHSKPRKGSGVPGDSSRHGALSGRGRTLTGLGAAALVTVLAVVVAGEVADGTDGEGRAERNPEAEASRETTPTPLPGAEQLDPSQSPRTPTYGELMHMTFPLDPGLTASGELVPVGGSDPAPNPDAATVLHYRVDVEAGMGLDPEFFAEVAQRTLNDDRSWSHDGERSFARVSGDDYDFILTLASPGTAAEWCARSGLDITVDNVSCDSAGTDRVIINAWRWAQGAETYGDDIAAYRQMLINHEVGHRLGFNHAVCPAEGALAPVMMQQTKWLTLDGVTCRANPWPHPED